MKEKEQFYGSAVALILPIPTPGVQWHLLGENYKAESFY